MLDAKLDHVAIAVRDVRSWIHLVVDALGARFLFGGDVEEQGFRWVQFAFPMGGKVDADPGRAIPVRR
jgi:catechol 2,3-dioxygenase-like lactoylglutathione lyase family enzyme